MYDFGKLFRHDHVFEYEEVKIEVYELERLLSCIKINIFYDDVCQQ